jgi:hypothetical protein
MFSSAGVSPALRKARALLWLDGLRSTDQDCGEKKGLGQVQLVFVSARC